VSNYHSTESNGSEQPNHPSSLDALGLIQVRKDLTIESRPWLIHELWPEQAIGFIGGQPKVGKSWLSLDLAVAVCVGGTFLGRPVSNPGTVLYFLGEDHRADALDRIDQLLAGRGLDRDALQGRLYISDWAPCLEDKTARDSIAKAVEVLRPALVILDPLARFLQLADENSAKDMRIVTNWLRHDLSRKGEVAVCICHHTNKQREDLRGTGDLRALSEVTILLFKSRKAVQVDVEMRSAKEPDPFHIRLETASSKAAWRVTDGLPVEASHSNQVRECLRRAGKSGVTVDAVSALLGVRWDNARTALENAGAVQPVPKGRWFAPEYAPGGSSQDQEERSNASSSDHSEEREECASNDASDTELDSSRRGEDLGSAPNSFLPPMWGLEETHGGG
jgi:hypothetical protein